MSESATTEGTQERLELSDAAADAYRARREALHGAVIDLDAELAALEQEPEPDAERFRAAMRRALATVQRHIEEADAPDGLLSEILDTAPWFASRAEQLRAEHAELLGHATRVLEQADATDDVEPLLADARSLSARISQHRHRGTKLLMDAYMLDVTAGD